MRFLFSTFIFLRLIFFSCTGFSAEKYIGLNQEQVSNLGGQILGGGMWGENLAVDQRRLSGKETIFLIEFYGDYQKQPNGMKRRSSRVVDVVLAKLKSDEKISDGGSFRCLDKQESVIGVFKKKSAKEKERFPATMAWKIDPSVKKIVPISDLSAVSCDWFRNGDEEFPKNL